MRRTDVRFEEDGAFKKLCGSMPVEAGTWEKGAPKIEVRPSSKVTSTLKSV